MTAGSNLLLHSEGEGMSSKMASDAARSAGEKKEGNGIVHWTCSPFLKIHSSCCLILDALTCVQITYKKKNN